MKFHSQNLNERGKFRSGSMFRHGRWWLNSANHHDWAVRCEWQWFSRTLSLEVGLATGEDAVSFSFCCGLIALYLSFSNPRLEKYLAKLTKRKEDRYSSGRTIGVRIFDNAVWIDLWNDPMSWHSKDPKWWHFNIRPIDLLLGREKYSERNLAMDRAEIPMPEGPYPANVRFFESQWKRSRWPWARKLIRAEITPDKPIPFPGKGENAWDCGEDATHSLTTVADTPLKATMAIVESVMRDRLRHGGRDWRPEQAHIA